MGQRNQAHPLIPAIFRTADSVLDSVVSTLLGGL